MTASSEDPTQGAVSTSDEEVSPRVPPVVWQAGARRAPPPLGPLSGKRTVWRRTAALMMATANRVLDRTRVGRWLHGLAQRRLAFTPVDVPLARGGVGLDGLKIAFLSDMHAGSCMDADDLCRIFERVAEHAPDLVLLGGDLINTRDREILLYEEPLRRLDPPLGVFAVPGNHDYFYGPEIGLWEAFLAERGVQVLTDRGVRLERGGATLWLAGVDDLTEGQPDLPRALSGLRADEPVVLVSHHPDMFFEAVAAGVDLTLAGHTHGGQIKILGRTPLKHTRFGWWEGMHEELGSRLYVSRGVGVTFLPVRHDADPEIPILTLRRPAAGS